MTEMYKNGCWNCKFLHTNPVEPPCEDCQYFKNWEYFIEKNREK